ncbi:alpha/beta hydrolase [Thiohalocapsa sp.]|uniref:alpha/beta hydrolase n=1 Tax=Thiohalocapsa sp. TaxID=2497641 RepID=UPI0025D8D802|nr:alpha/beta hydrolase [Thiohalocapsa sp.]
MHNQRDAAIPTPLREWLEQTRAAKAAAHANGYRRTVINARETFDALIRTFVTDRPEVALVRDDVILGPDYAVPVRLYHPAPDEARPVALFLHGGGHVAGSVAAYDPIARKLALATGRVIVAVEYRLAPECPYPAALRDSMACAKLIFHCLSGQRLRHARRLALIGDSAGGALCATVSHLAQYEPDVAIEAQALLYPSLDYSLAQPSVMENAEGYLLERERILWLFDSYLQGHENRRAISPLFMDITERYPRTLVLTAEFDPLRDEGIAYVERLREHSIATEHWPMSGMVHAYLNLEDLVPEACAETYTAVGHFLDAGG